MRRDTGRDGNGLGRQRTEKWLTLTSAEAGAPSDQVQFATSITSRATRRDGVVGVSTDLALEAFDLA
jgi:hypothetical protein